MLDYQKNHDEYEALIEKFNEKYRYYKEITFGVEIIRSSDGVFIGDFDKKRKITTEELKELISKYEQLDALVEKITKETHIIY